jgi:hypothetical protein
MTQRLRVAPIFGPTWYRDVATAVNLMLADIPEGGTTGQVLAKSSSVDRAMAWTSLTKSSVGLGNVDNTSDANKPVSTATQTALDLKAPLASPAFTGVPRLPSYTVATLPAVGTAGGVIYVSDESGGAVPAFSDGTNWRRVTDRAVVS